MGVSAPLAAAVFGRANEAHRLADAIAEARAGRAACVLLIGEGGIGKTRLMAGAASLARESGIATLGGRAAITGPVGYGVIAEALRSWCRDHPLATDHTPYDPGLRLVLPEWPVAKTGRELTQTQLRLLALEGVVHVVRELARRHGGAVVMIDDLHAADPESIEVARYLGTASIPGVAVIAAMRPAETAAADRLVDELTSSGVATVIALEPLDAVAVSELVESMARATPMAEFVDAVIGQTDGVPLLVEEVVAAHLRTGSVTVTDGEMQWHQEDVAVPRTIRGMVSARLDRLDAYHRPVILAAAVIGEFSPEILAEVSESQSVDAAVAAATSVGIVDISSGAPVFRHAIIRAAVVETIGGQALARLHRRAATALARAGSDATLLERRAHHLSSVGDVDEAAALLIEAARTLLHGHALLGAEQLAHSAATLARDPLRRVAAADILSAALTAQGRWTEALDQDRAVTDEYGETAERRHRMATAALEAGLPALASEVIARAAAAGDTGGWLQVASGRAALIAGDAESALESAARIIDDPAAEIDLVLSALDLRGRAFDFLGRRNDAKQAWTEQAERAIALGRTQAHVRAAVQLGKVELFEGGAGTLLREAVELARNSGAFAELAWAEENLAIGLALSGKMDAARELLDDAIPRAQRLRLDQAAYLFTARAMVEEFCGGDPDGYFAAAEALSTSENLRLHVASGRGDIALRSGRYAEAIRWFEDARQIMLATPGVVPMDSPCWLIWALAAHGQIDEARAMLAEVRTMPDLERWHTRPRLLDAVEALLDGDVGRLEDIVAGEGAWSPIDIGLIRLIGADLVDGERRVAWLREALNVYDQLGPPHTATRIRQQLREEGAAVPRKHRAGAEVPRDLNERRVTSREFEVLVQLRDGLSNAEIAEQLVVSVRTVESHVSSLLTKLGVERRAQLIAVAVQASATGGATA